jgi:uncharacterized membrane protein (UPF0127 family)
MRLINFKNIINHKLIIICTFVFLTGIYAISVYANSDKYFAKINDNTIFIKISDTPQDRTKGLMETDKLDFNSGMLFVFDKSDFVSFWMKNMKISLDMIFISDEKIVKIYNNVPICKNNPCKIYPSGSKVNYVLEVNSGYCKKNNVKEGQSIKFNQETLNRINKLRQ